MIEKWFKQLLMSIICSCAKFLFEYVAVYVPNKKSDEVVSIVFSKDKNHISHMCEYEGAKKNKKVSKS